MKKLFVLAMVGLWLSSGAVLAADADAGKAKSGVCAGCHGANGMSVIPGYPNLAGQNEMYLAKQLKAFKSGARKNPIMTGIVAALSDEDMDNLAAYYASLACK